MPIRLSALRIKVMASALLWRSNMWKFTHQSQ